MTNLFDELLIGTCSRREFLERLSSAGLAVPLIGGAAADAAAQGAQQQRPKPTPERDDEGQVLSPAFIGGGGRVERNFYRDWIKTSKVPMIEAYSLFDAKNQEVFPWPEIGGRGVYLNFSGNVHMDALIMEIPEGKALVPRRQFYEQIVYVLGGRGFTLFGEGRQQNKVEWGEGSLFAPPANVVHRHFNSDPARPARLLAITSFPLMIQTFGSLALINHLNFDFTDRYSGDRDYFTQTKRVRQRWDRANFIRDIRSSEVVAWEERGKGNASMYWEMAGNTVLEPHISEFPVATYKLGHRHPYEAVILTLNGKGYSLSGKETLKEHEGLVKIDWKAGSIVSPPYFWYHQHFNSGDIGARYLAITEGDFPKRLGIPLDVEQIEADQEDPEIRERFERELQKSGVRPEDEDHPHGYELEHHEHDHVHGHLHDHE